MFHPRLFYEISTASFRSVPSFRLFHNLFFTKTPWQSLRPTNCLKLICSQSKFSVYRWSRLFPLPLAFMLVDVRVLMFGWVPFLASLRFFSFSFSSWTSVLLYWLLYPSFCIGFQDMVFGFQLNQFFLLQVTFSQLLLCALSGVSSPMLQFHVFSVAISCLPISNFPRPQASFLSCGIEQFTSELLRA